MSFGSGANPDVVLTELDDVFYQEYDRENLNHYVELFHKMSSLPLP